MNGLKSFKDRLLYLKERDFEKHALQLFRFQAEHNPVYRDYIQSLDITTEAVLKSKEIPFLPISAFKYRTVKTLEWDEACVFESSGTSGMETSKNYVEDLSFYQRISKTIFEKNFGAPTGYHILALLPDYLERKNSSLIHMVGHLIEESRSDHSGFYLSNLEELKEKVLMLKKDPDRRIMLWGVTFALLDLARRCSLDMGENIIIETGGMKGHGEELVREEVHDILQKRFNVEAIHSEYGMTELLSQAYSTGMGVFHCPPWMRVYTREINDPFSITEPGDQGVINIIDLANIHSCAFIASEDLGRIHADGSFEVLGRLDNSDMRGCNLLVS